MSATTRQPSPIVNLAARGNTFPLDAATTREALKQKKDRRQQAAPPKLPVTPRHLDELALRNNTHRQPCPADHITHHHHPDPSQAKKDDDEKKPPKKGDDHPTTPEEPDSSSPPRKSPTKRLKEPLSIRPKSLQTFLVDGLRLYISNLKNPDQIPGTDWFSRVYAMGLLPVLVVSMAVVQGGIGLLVMLITYTEVGAKYYKRFFENEIALFDDSGRSFCLLLLLLLY